MTQSARLELPAIPGGWTERDVACGPRTFRLALPAAPDDFLDDPDVQAANRRDDYMPYWPHLWPASVTMARLILEEPWPPRTPALELGTGIGLTGLAMAAAGLDATFSDYDRAAVDLALFNALRNGLTNAQGLVLDWRDPPATRFPVILGCEVVYERVSHGPILNLLDRMLTDDGVCWIGDPGRENGALFAAAARERGWRVTLRDDAGRAADAMRIGEFRLIALRR